MNQRERQTRSASFPNQTPACRGLVTFITAGSRQARSRPGGGRGGEGGGAVRINRTTPTPNPSPQGGGERTECAVSLNISPKKACSMRLVPIVRGARLDRERHGE